MKVIAEAKDNPNIWTGEFTCTGDGWEQQGKTPCGSLLEITALDLQRRKHINYSYVVGVYYGFTCCKCGCFTEIPDNKIPYQAKKFAQDY